MGREIKDNRVELIGEIASGFEYSHEVFGEKFYTTYINSYRQNGTADTIPFMVSDRMIKIEDLSGLCVKICGQFRSYNKHIDGKSKLQLSVFVSSIEEVEESTDLNFVELNGYICKKPIYRETPLGREICDIVLAVNRPYDKSDYIPCICWGRNAHYVSSMEVGTKIKVTGRAQSRVYQKSISETEFELKTAYEVSVKNVVEVGE